MAALSPHCPPSCTMAAAVLCGALYVTAHVVIASPTTLPPDVYPTGSEQDIHLAGVIPLSGDVWNAGQAMVLAADMAIEDINSRGDILRGYNLTLHVEDSRVSPLTAICLHV